jgi:2-dehydropantoate 2-reductase
LRSYALIGPGAVGGLYAGRLAAAGHELHVLARSDAEHIRANGLIVDSSDGTLHVHPHVHTDPSTIPVVDVVLVGVKTTANDSLAQLVGPVARAGTTVVLLQNGLGLEATAAAALPDAVILGGLCFVCAVKDGPGHVRLLDYGAVNVGQHTGDGSAAGVTPEVAAVVADMAASGTDVSAADDLIAARWRKLVWNIPFNGLSVVLDAGTDELMADPATRALVEDLMAEVAAAAGACGKPVPDGFPEEMLRTTETMVPYKPSMKLDYDGGRPLELDAIYGAPIRAALAAGCAVPRIEAVHRQLAFLDQRKANQARKTAR